VGEPMESRRDGGCDRMKSNALIENLQSRQISNASS